MAPDDQSYLISKIKEEGFDYCFDGYSTWSDIKDDYFQTLLNAYLEAKNNLLKYIKKNE